MNTYLPLGLSLVFLVLALIHVYWAFFGLEGNLSAVPSIDGKPAFRPTPLATILVALVLALIALLAAAMAGLVTLPLPQSLLTWATYAVGAGFLLRAIGVGMLAAAYRHAG